MRIEPLCGVPFANFHNLLLLWPLRDPFGHVTHTAGGETETALDKVFLNHSAHTNKRGPRVKETKESETVKYYFRLERKLNSSGEFPPDDRIVARNADLRKISRQETQGVQVDLTSAKMV